MRVLLQRVARASVSVQKEIVGAIDHGLLALVGVGQGDDAAVCRAMAQRSVRLRIFEDDTGQMNRDLIAVGGAMLAVSQFTLFADCRKGRRPYFGGAAKGDAARQLFEVFVAEVQTMGVSCASGRFGALMQVELVNQGPVSIWLDSLELERPRRAAAPNCPITRIRD